MRHQTLRSYTINNLDKYLSTYTNKQKRLSTLLLLSKNDSRLAELSQSFFFANNKMDEGNLFFEYTNEKYDSLPEFLASNNKFVYLFNKKQEAKLERKKLLRIKLLEKKMKNDYSFYKMAKLLNTSQSNVDLFFKKEEYNKMSTEQLRRLDKII